MKRFIIFLFLAGSAFAYEAFQGPTETIYWNTNQTDNGYTLFGIRGTTYLIDMQGYVVHTWPVGTNPHLLSDGSVLDALQNADLSGFGSFVQVSWSGSNLWQYSETRMNYLPHHDFLRIYNPKLAPRFSVNDPSRWVITLQERGLVAGVFAAVVG
jgi:hypothetical protein